MIIYITTCLLLDIPRFYLGKLPRLLCFISVLTRNSCQMIFIMLMNCTAVVKFLFVFVLRNPVACHDQFWSTYIFSWSILCCLMFQLTRHLLMPRLQIPFYICSGCNPYRDGLHAPVFRRGFEIFSLLLNVSIKISILIRKHKILVRIE